MFHFKAHQIFTHGNSDYAKLPRVIRDVWPHPHGPSAKEIQLDDVPESIQEQLLFLFNLALKEVHQAEKLGIVIFQFPENFVCNHANKALILKFRKWLEAPFKMGLELRSDTWFFDAADHADFKVSLFAVQSLFVLNCSRRGRASRRRTRACRPRASERRWPGWKRRGRRSR